MLVFRDGRRSVNGPRLLTDLASLLQRLSRTSTFNQDLIIDALLCAGQLECGLTDARSPAAGQLSKVTDALAAALVQAEPPRAELPQTISALAVPETLTVSRPESFSYYALHPLHFADLVAELRVPSRRVGVVGIRSIGTTLSAVVAAAARKRGFAAERITLRPTGHPWDRRLDFTVCERAWSEAHNDTRAEFWVVDEGPGLSGSSFLAVGEALVSAGVPRERITLLGSAPPDLSCLRAPNAAARWRQFQSHFTRPQQRLPADAAVSICAGQWRQTFLNGDRWPAVWPQFERAKFLSVDHKSLFKFEGLGSYGCEVRKRSTQIAGAGFGPPIGEQENGYARYEVVEGRIPTATDVSEHVLQQIAAYCAWRAETLVAEPSRPDDMEEMIRTNAREGLGADVEVSKLRIQRPVIADGSMHPHEWRLMPTGRLLKTDGASHGDDHFFPGPTDIAWDLAGTIIEWGLKPPAAEYFLESYCRASGDDARDRLPEFALAYALFRLGYCAMAAESLRGAADERRFHRDIDQYRAICGESMRNAVQI